MHTRIGSAALGALALALMSCTDRGPAAPLSPTGPRRAEGDAAALLVRISELHYDNGGTDVGERIEVSAPAGTVLDGWQLVLYNGGGGAPYRTDALGGTVADQCRGRGTAVVAYAANGIQNGSPDGVALVDPTGAVVEFLSYEGSFTAVGGPADGSGSVDIGASEAGTEPAGQSLQRDSLDVWTGPTAATFGACNAGEGTPRPAAAVASVTVAPATAAVPQGSTQPFTAAALDAAGQPVAGAAINWSSSAPAVATVDAATGVATGLTPGDAVITATAANGVVGSATLTVTPPPAADLPPVRFSELHYDNAGTDVGEAIEIEGPAGTDLTGWQVVLYTGSTGTVYNTRALAGTIPALCGARGVVQLDYPVNGIQNGGLNASEPDGLALVNNSGEVVEFLSYEGEFAATDGPAAGRRSISMGVDEDPAPGVGLSLQRGATGAWAAAAPASFGACNPAGGGDGGTTPGGRAVTVSGRSASDDPALPVGFEDQLFAVLRDGVDTVQTTFTWSSETPALAEIDQRGVVTARGGGTAVLRATAADGTSGTVSLPTRVATAAIAARYADNVEFGEPADGDASDDLVVRRPRFTSSFNRGRGIPNWVSYNLEATHFGTEDRCDCFTYDPALPADFPRYTTADYTGAGAAAGFGIDRGHLVRSADRTGGSLDNAETFYFTNIIPQAADNNQGPWAAFESYLGGLARDQTREVYIVAGAAGGSRTVKDEGRITIPANVWKVAVILPRDQGLASVTSAADLEVVAVNMPNVAGIRNVPWETYKVTVDSVEALSGYDLLTLLPDEIEAAVEGGPNAAPTITALRLDPAAGPFRVSAKACAGRYTACVRFSVADPNGAGDGPFVTALDWGDGTAWTPNPVPAHTPLVAPHDYAAPGVYAVRVTVTDRRGASATATLPLRVDP